MDSKAQVEAARSVRLDPDRAAVALRRVAAAREVMAYHEEQATAQRSNIATLMRTWSLCPHEQEISDSRQVYAHITVDGPVECCLHPEDCTGPA